MIRNDRIAYFETDYESDYESDDEANNGSETSMSGDNQD